MSKPFAVVLTAILVSATLLVGIGIIDQIATTTEEASATTGEDVTRDGVLLEGTGTKVTVADGFGEDETVYKTTGYAVNLTGASDSYVQSESNIDFSTDDNWTVSLWASQSPAASLQQRAVLSLNGRLIIYHQPVAGNWSAWFYDDGSTNSYKVNVSTSGGPGALQNVIVWSNGTHLAIYRNNTVGEVKNITSENIADAPVSSSNWHGRLEEIRTFNEALDSTNRSELVNSPVEQQTDLDRTSRIMFDQPDRSVQIILFASGDLTQSNVTYSPGFPEQIMDGQNIGNDLTGQTDYIWYPQEPAIEPTSGGELDGAPVAYVSYTFDDTFEDIKDQVVAGLVFAGIIPLAILSVLILRILRDL